MTDLTTFETPSPEQIVTITTETAGICPYAHGVDTYDVTIEYRGPHTAETDSLAAWLRTYHDRKITAEALTDELYTTLADAIEPDDLYVELVQCRHGTTQLTTSRGTPLRQ